MFSKKVVVVECAASRTALGIFALRGGRLCLERHAVERLPVPAGGTDRWLEDTRTALAALGRRFKAAGPVTLVLPPHLVLAKMIRLPPVEPTKRAQVLGFEAEQGIPHALADVVWDTVVAAEQDAAVEVLLAAVKRSMVEPLCAALQAAGFRPRLVLPSSLAMLAAFRLGKEIPPEPSLVLNLGARSATLLLLEGRRFLTRTLALGVLDAQRVASPGEDVREALAVRLAQEITRTVLYFRRQNNAENPARVYLAGGGACLAGMAETLAARIKIPVERLALAEAIGIAGGDVAGEAGENAPVLSELAGAAAIQLLPGQPALDLLPPSWRHQESRRRVRRLQLAGAAMLVAGALWPVLHDRTPAARPRPATAVVSRETVPLPAEPVVATPSAEHLAEAGPANLELPAAKFEPPRLRLAGYFGGPDDYTVAFVSPDRPETLLVRSGGQIGDLGLVLRSFDVRKIITTDPEGRPAHDIAAIAVLHDKESGEEVVLDSRRRNSVANSQ